MSLERTARIRALNDQLRQDHIGGRILISQGVIAQGPAFVLASLQAIKRFDNFNEINDPYAEHDFGVVVVGSDRVFWKIDYYDHTLTSAGDPTDPASCVRVMTVLLPEEY